MTDVYQTKLDRLFAKYRHSPNILKVFEILADPKQDTRDILDWFQGQLSIGTAEGVILDFFGELIGVLRPPNQEPDILWLCGDWELADDVFNRFGLAPEDELSGGYCTGDNGCLHKTNPGVADDETYREYIYSKASTYRRNATRAVLYDYLLFFGCRFKVLEPANREIEFEPYDYAVINYHMRNYIETRGFRPAGIEVTIKNQTTPLSEV